MIASSLVVIAGEVAHCGGKLQDTLKCHLAESLRALQKCVMQGFDINPKCGHQA